MSETAYPLSWPLGYPREIYRAPSSFGTGLRMMAHKRISLAEVLRRLQAELDRLNASKVVLSTNLELNLNGSPRGNAPHAFIDPGVALYFELKGKRIVLPSDKWDRVECNLMALVKHIEALRGLDRWGVGTVERNFAGYQALPEKGTQAAWYDILKVPANAPEPLIEDAFRNLAKVAHPDRGGDVERWHQLNEARQQGLTAARGGAS